MTDRAVRRAFVCGHPVAHSRSPLIHGYWLGQHGIDGSYERVDRAPADFPAFAANLGPLGYAGGNVTIPHKEAALAACDIVEPTAREIGAVNTLWLENGRLNGDNTDAYGFAANLDEHAPGWSQARSAVVLGAGGAARAVVHALASRGVTDIRIVNRTIARAQDLADRFGGESTAHPLAALPELAADAGLVVNTTSIGMEGHDADDDMPWVASITEDAIVTDIVYVPLVTPLLAAASARGLRTVDGLGMLLHQAVPGFERWFGVRPSVTPALRSLVERDMAR